MAITNAAAADEVVASLVATEVLDEAVAAADAVDVDGGVPATAPAAPGAEKLDEIALALLLLDLDD